MSLNIIQFFTVCTRLAFQATRILRDVKESGDLKEHFKGITPVTKADVKVQCMIRSALKKIWPDLRIVGQENQVCVEPTHDHFKNINNIIIQGSMFARDKQGKRLQKDLPLSDCCAWIDPLDATTSYTLGRLSEISSLVGLSYKKKAKLGILGIPYKEGNSFKPSVMIGDADHPIVYVIDEDFRIKQRLSKRPVPKNYTIANIQNGSEYLKSFVNSIGRETIQTSGCGHKIVMMLEGKVDAMVFPGKQTSKWDTCASEALIKAVDGRMTDLYGDDIYYDPDKPPYKNDKGLICTLEPWQLEDILKTTNTFNLD